MSSEDILTPSDCPAMSSCHYGGVVWCGVAILIFLLLGLAGCSAGLTEWQSRCSSGAPEQSVIYRHTASQPVVIKLNCISDIRLPVSPDKISPLYN